MEQLIKRSVTGIFFVIAFLFSIISGKITYFFFFATVLSIGLWEFLTLHLEENRRGLILTIFLGVVIFILTFLHASGVVSVTYLWLLLPLLSLLSFFAVMDKSPGAFRVFSIRITGLLYIGGTISLINYLVFHPDIVFFPFSEWIHFPHTGNEFQPGLLLGIIVIIWMYDTSAYVVGSLFGKHKLLERLSPKKSWEGFAGGGMITLAVGIFFFPEPLHASIIAIIIITAGTLGDLFESLIKREAGVKDSGRILPGHGGILDRFDTLFMVVPLILTYIYIFV